MIYYRRDRPRNRFRECDLIGQKTDLTVVTDHLWARLQAIFKQHGATIVLKLSSLVELSGSKAEGDKHAATASARGAIGLAPLLRTRSALGMLNNMTAGDNLVLFGDRDKVSKLIGSNVREADSRCLVSFYYESTEFGDDSQQHDGHANERFTNFNGERDGALTPNDSEKERRLGDERRLILIEASSTPPPDAFVSVFHSGLWYSIQERDIVSKRNFALVGQIDTIQASASASPSPVPTINVGPR